VQHVENGEPGRSCAPGSVTFMTADGAVVEREERTVDWDEEDRREGRLRDVFMLKEIHETGGRGLRENDRGPHGSRKWGSTSMMKGPRWRGLRAAARQPVVIVACGTAYHAGP